MTLVDVWNPETYLQFADHRGRPYVELLARVDARSPRRIIDLGCGPGNLTARLAQRWPGARIEAWDSSPDMVAAAQARGLDARLGDVRDWSPTDDTDVVVSNATLHWVPGHADLMVSWARRLPTGAWLAVQVPGNFDAPSHGAIRTLAAAPRWADLLGDLAEPGKVVETPAGYAGRLSDEGCTVDAWETTYLHELTGAHPVLDWVTGTALTPVRNRLTDEQWQAFRAELAPMLDEAYPPRPDGRTFFPFRRVFVVAQVG